MAEMLFKTKGNASPSGKARVYFTCHPDDFDLYFEQVCEYIFKSHDCAIYYAEDMSAVMDETDLENCNLFVAPVTFKLLSTENRAMDDVKFAMDKHIPVLPLMMEAGIDSIYSRPDKFGELQYLSPLSTDTTEVSFEEKLNKYLESVLVSDEMAKRVRAAFDAYIFLSYRKKDRKYANQLMRIIHDKPECRDIAIWYDEFLTPGESFRENIDKILADSKLFTLLITPNLLEDHNFVMDNEYPAAIKSGIGILPAEMEDTDKSALAEKYANLPEIANPYDDETFRNRLVDTLSNLAIKSNDDDPEHNFLIGLAYLDGIDVEVNRERALELITKAAEAELPEAMEKLYDMYKNGTGVNLNYHKATEWRENILQYHINKYGPRHKVPLNDMLSLADCYDKVGDYNKVLQICENAYDISVSLYAENNDFTITALNNLTSCYSKLGNYSKVAELTEKTYTSSLETYGENHINTITALHNYSTYYNDIGNYNKAIEIEEKVYASIVNIWGEEDVKAMSSLSDIAVYNSKIYNFEKALEIGKKVYSLRCKVLGENHPDTVTALANLSSYYSGLNNPDKAIEISEKAYLMRCNVLGKTHPSTINTFSNIAYYYDQVGRHREAVELAEQAYLLRCNILGEEHPDTLISLNNYALYAHHTKDNKKSAELGEKAYTLSLKLLGEMHPYTAIITNNLSSVYYELGYHRKVLNWDVKSYEIRRMIFGETHPETITSANNLIHSTYIVADYDDKTRDILYTAAVNHKNIKQYQKSIKLCKRILKSEYKSNGKNTLKSAQFLICLGESHYAVGHNWRAKNSFKKAYAIRLNTLGAEHKDTMAIKAKLDEIR